MRASSPDRRRRRIVGIAAVFVVILLSGVTAALVSPWPGVLLVRWMSAGGSEATHAQLDRACTVRNRLDSRSVVPRRRRRCTTGRVLPVGVHFGATPRWSGCTAVAGYQARELMPTVTTNCWQIKASL